MLIDGGVESVSCVTLSFTRITFATLFPPIFMCCSYIIDESDAGKTFQMIGGDLASHTIYVVLSLEKVLNNNQQRFASI